MMFELADCTKVPPSYFQAGKLKTNVTILIRVNIQNSFVLCTGFIPSNQGMHTYSFGQETRSDSHRNPFFAFLIMGAGSCISV